MNLRVLLIVLACLAFSGTPARAFLDFWRKIPGLGGTKKVEKQSMPRLRLETFNGGTGSSATQSLRQELLTSREFFVAATEEDFDYTLEGSSVGGRVTGRLLDKKGKEMFQRSYAAPGLDENLKALADDVIFVITGRPGLATSRIVFVSDKSGRKQIYITDSDGKDVQQVTHDRLAAVAPSLSPDGSMIAFTSYGSGFPGVRLIDIHSGWDREISDTPGSSYGAAFSPEGSRLAMVMTFIGNPEIFVSDLNSNTAACISDSVGAPSSPSWHPDGRQLVFSNDDGSGPGLYVAEVPAKEGEPAKLFRWRTGWSGSTDPEWSPDGKQIAFTAMRGGQRAVVVKPWPSGSSRLVQSGGAGHPSWSPNGRYLCYSQQGALYIHDVISGSRRVLLRGFGHISEPRWMR
ncbi:MAG: PD40 domain-containing protein [Verrucomicrobiaceae bacterium]|jgi:TolB protein|nr:PD40 domain-containing protein [Verrucomicrobiaceae bacterium]